MPPGARRDRRPRRLRGRAGLRRCSPRAPDAPPPTGSACGSSARRSSSGLDGVDGIEVVADRGVDRQRGGPGARGPRQAGGLGRARRRATSPRARADAMVSAGSTGATMAAATFGLRRLQGRAAAGARRAAAGPRQARCSSSTSAPTSRSAPSTWSSSPSSAPPSAPPCSGSSGPRVGLLSVGEESGKGREEVVEAHALLAEAPGIDFAGNVEGGDLPGRRSPTSSSPTASPATSP